MAMSLIHKMAIFGYLPEASSFCLVNTKRTPWVSWFHFAKQPPVPFSFHLKAIKPVAISFCLSRHDIIYVMSYLFVLKNMLLQTNVQFRQNVIIRCLFMHIIQVSDV